MLWSASINGLKLPLTKPEETGLAVGSIEGLGPGKAVVASASYGLFDGGYISAMAYGIRNIVFNLIPLDSPSVQENRYKLYSYCQIGKQVELSFQFDWTNGPWFTIDGIIESVEPTIFSKNQAIQVSILCPQPFFESWKGLQTAKISYPSSTIISYEGSVRTGYVYTLTAKGTVSGTFYLDHGPGRQRIDLRLLDSTNNTKMESGDQITISSLDGDKFARYRRKSSGATFNILKAMQSSENFLYLSPGDNTIRYSIVGTGASLLDVQVEYKTLYSGL